MVRSSSCRPTLRLIRGFWFSSVGMTLLFALFIAYRQIYGYLDQPEAILMLGGSSPDLERERFTAQVASQHPELPIWISSGGSSPKPYERSTRSVFTQQGVTLDQLHFDYQAQDTVTNFTTLVQELKARNINSIYLVTSDYHMPRARLVGDIVFGSQGIYFRTIAVPSTQSREPLGKTLRDGFRALLWVATGKTGRN
ncbi:MAG: YdcF family protein [Leptolyngbyaceae cyanobacterium bins.59]|nr:YdcF family protein [Leptolyngbyaceae cyanobacterium bins.59]